MPASDPRRERTVSTCCYRCGNSPWSQAFGPTHLAWMMQKQDFAHLPPYAKDFQTPSRNALVPMLLGLTDATGSSADLVKVSIARLGGAS